MKKTYSTPDIQLVSLGLPKSVCQTTPGQEANPSQVNGGSPTKTEEGGWAPVRVYF